MSLTLQKVEDKKALKLFIDYPHDLYKGDINYVPELHIAIKELLDEKKNPYFRHSKAELYLAWRDDTIVGRIASTVNTNYNEFHQCKVAFFGFFDCIDDQEVADLLLDQAVAYVKDQGIERILGPTNLSTNDTAGVLIKGYDSPPVVQMTYNKPYYQTLLENYGFTKEMDLFAYLIETEKVNEKSLRLASLLKSRLAGKGILFRGIKMKDFDREVKAIREIYLAAWEKNWGFVPPTKEEFDFLAEGLKMIVDPRYAYMAEHDGRLVGFAVGLPNINEILINVKRGRLFPTGLFKLLLGKKKTKVLRIVLLGVIPEYRKMGIEGVFFANFIQAAKDNGLFAGEASWILENNQMMVQAAENLNGYPYKTYRIFTKDI